MPSSAWARERPSRANLYQQAAQLAALPGGGRFDCVLDSLGGKYFSAALELTRREMQAGKSKEEITSTESLAGFEDHVSPFALLSLNGVLGVAYDELSAR